MKNITILFFNSAIRLFAGFFYFKTNVRKTFIRRGNMKKGTRIIFALILLFATVFADVRFVKAETNPKAATVYRIYAKMVENEEGYYEPDFDSLEIAENNPEGKDLIAKFITDGTYVPKISINLPSLAFCPTSGAFGLSPLIPVAIIVIEHVSAILWSYLVPKMTLTLLPVISRT